MNHNAKCNKHAFYDFWYFLWLFHSLNELKNSKNCKHSKTFYGLQIRAILRELWAKMCFL